MSLTIQIVTPENIAYTGEAESITIPGADGELEILPGHVGLIVPIIPGILRLTGKNNAQQVMATGEGFAEVDSNRVSILTDMAIKEDDSEAAAEEAMRRAREAMDSRDGTSAENDAMTAALTAAFSQIKSKRLR